MSVLSSDEDVLSGEQSKGGGGVDEGDDVGSGGCCESGKYEK